MSQIFYYSTNHHAPEVPLADALLAGQAPDRGLYMPRSIPVLAPAEVEGLKHLSYAETAAHILGKFTEGTFPPHLLLNLCQDAYDYEVPLEPVRDKQYIMRLDRGPTASFKDFAARMMARMFGMLLQMEKRELIILTATSGDTGSAIAHAFYQVPNIQVMVLFPPDEVSNRQRKQMTTLGGNITIVGVDGQFDDCQALVKRAFADRELKKLPLTSANSINIGRLLPQAVYYVYACARLARRGEPVTFSVPSGNFGNMMGALLAGRMGVPVEKLIIATNSNDEVPRYMESGEYHKIVPSRACISNAMNVGHPSNFARVVDLYGGHMDETGKIHRQPDLNRMRKDLWAVSISEEETRQTIKAAWQDHRLLLEPHGAVGWAGLQRYAASEKTKGLMISVETAHPAKFPEEIQALLGFDPEVPAALTGLEKKKENWSRLPVDYDAFRNLLINTYAS